MNIKSNSIKHECDLIITSNSEKYAIELKNPRNAPFSKRMMHFIKDLQFMEQLKKYGFTNTFCLCLVDTGLNKAFYDGESTTSPYCFFRGVKLVLIHGKIQDLYADKTYEIEGSYQISWIDCNNGNNKYYLIKI
jgi:hypothetical protein